MVNIDGISFRDMLSFLSKKVDKAYGGKESVHILPTSDKKSVILYERNTGQNKVL